MHKPKIFSRSIGTAKRNKRKANCWSSPIGQARVSRLHELKFNKYRFFPIIFHPQPTSTKIHYFPALNIFFPTRRKRASSQRLFCVLTECRLMFNARLVVVCIHDNISILFLLLTVSVSRCWQKRNSKLRFLTLA